jgi:hypothetical protein
MIAVFGWAVVGIVFLIFAAQTVAPLFLPHDLGS